MRSICTILVLTESADTAQRFAELVVADVGRLTSERGTPWHRWSATPLRCQDQSQSGKLGVLTLVPPRRSVIPALELSFLLVDRTFLTAQQDWQAVSPSAVVMFVEARKASVSWGDVGRTVLFALNHARTGIAQRIPVTAALVAFGAPDPEAQRAVIHESEQLERVLIDHVARTRSFSYEECLRASFAAEVVHWSAIGLNEHTLSSGIAAAIARTSAPALVWCAAFLWASIVVAPSACLQVLGWLLEILPPGKLASSASEGALELRNFDAAIVVVAATLLAVGAVVLRFTKSLREGPPLRYFCYTAILVAWLLALAPRAVLVSLATALLPVVSTRLAEVVTEAGLRAMDLRPASILVAAIATASALAINAVGQRRRERSVARERNAIRATLVGGRPVP